MRELCRKCRTTRAHASARNRARLHGVHNSDGASECAARGGELARKNGVCMRVQHPLTAYAGKGGGGDGRAARPGRHGITFYHKLIITVKCKAF